MDGGEGAFVKKKRRNGRAVLFHTGSVKQGDKSALKNIFCLDNGEGFSLPDNPEGSQAVHPVCMWPDRCICRQPRSRQKGYL